MRYRIEAQNQRAEKVLTMERVLLIKRRSHWAERDQQFSAASSHGEK
jgi:hypothetical protein